jgi:hypothetical protein
MLKKIHLSLLILISFSSFSQDMTAVVKTINSVSPGKDFIVELTVNKPGITGFIKYFQELPAGFSASVIDGKGGDFTVADNGAKIIWITPPSDDQMIVTYKISTPQSAGGSISVGGKFSYVVGNERKIAEIVPQNVIISSSQASSGQKEETKTPVKENPPVVETKQAATETKQQVTEPKQPMVESKKETTQPEQKKEVPPIITTPAKVPATASSIIPGRTYKVQIGAFSSKPKVEGVPEQSTMVLENGVTKYFSGNFKTYEEAAKRKKEMIDKGFPGAFVVSFENGKIVK